MGGDFAPEEVVKGAVEAAAACPAELVLVGREPAILAELKRHRTSGLNLSIVHAAEVVAMHESPATAVRTKRDSSLVAGIDMVKSGRADAFVSAGNSGAVMAAALLFLGRIGGIERPALGAVMPGVHGRWLLIDAGANVDCKPLYLQQFALMGSVYARLALGVANPTVALLSNGEEESKGSQLVIESHRLLRESGVTFVGNIEGREVPWAHVNVVVTDGFVGNIVLKFGEGVAAGLLRMVQQEVEVSLLTRLAAIALLPALRRLKRRVDYAEYGGAPLLGVEGICIVAHGSSRAKAIRNAVLMAQQAVEQDLVAAIKAGVATIARAPAGKRPVVASDGGGQRDN